MSDYHGKFVWYELLTPDPAASEAFYRAVVGWNVEKMGPDEAPYRILKAGDEGVAGISSNPPAGGKGVWMGYIATDDVDRDTDRAKAMGATLHYGPDDIPGIGRFSMIGDPQGAIVYLFDPIPPQGRPEPAPPAPGAPGHFGWRELVSTDGPAGFDFYSRLVGWQKGEGLDMGDMGVYQLYSARDGEALGGIMTGPPGSPAPFWNYYIQVDGIDAAIKRFTPLGATVMMGPHQVPTGQWIVQGLDPQGIMFCLLSNNP
jgi:predicted enzyme related to lactoylglutathione lyase